jgi:hypothetical protein
VTVITTLHVTPDGAISIPEKLPAGDYTAMITVPEMPPPRRSMLDLPIHHGPWDDSISLRREDGAALWISRQVLRECMVAVTRPNPAGVPPMTWTEAATAVEGFLTPMRSRRMGRGPRHAF